MVKYIGLCLLWMWAFAVAAAGLPDRAVFSYNGVLWFVTSPEAFTPMQAFEREQQLISDSMIIYRLSHQGEAARFVSTQLPNTALVPMKKEDRIFLPVNVDAVRVKDPLTQELLVIFPQADVFVPRTMETLEVKFPATRTGVAVVVKKDSVRFENTEEGVDIILNRPAALTQDVAFVPASRKGALDFSEEKQKEAVWFVQETQKLRALVDGLSMTQSTMLKLELARLYLSQGLVPEALSVLNTMRTDDALALKGLALWLREDPEGVALLENVYLKSDTTVAAWLKAIQTHFAEEQVTELRAQTTDALLASALLVALKHNPSNATVIQELYSLPLDKYQAQYFAFLQGKTNIQAGTDLSPEQCRLRFVRALDMSKQKPAEAIAELEMLRLAYPDATFVAQVNVALFPLYKQTRDYVSALPLCPKSEREDLLQEGLSVLQNPFDRLTLWYAFDELEKTVPEKEGIRQKIFNDYLSMDLPDEAARFQARWIQK